MDLIQRLRNAARLLPTTTLADLLNEAATELDEIRALVMPGALHRQQVALALGLSIAADLADLDKTSTSGLLRGNLIASAD